ncbi:hypothetical protein [Bordetella bronchiseptica]|uniref:hypothetical protein n=1 Tax=Bordetella bronchiseptica TaxID=518 RepID=UPI00028BB584|nr:hypothetical protein [Bordetella bronchiseptica]AUL16203.1 hypothetical protein BTL45_15420 [Bordetella bronchiseptica]AWP59427.1 hypothetical protein B7P02_16040 [Bordetella bronchiseptica]AWQ06072.1 hypothetical protein B9G73_15520 [Bordetella bronchiseptica]QIX99245.1 hypothetical protein FOC01_03800 [Bordetella bronchiseptica]CCJ59742.1 hypothetical protein BN115_2986 [Bordetella bronchiseptica MO149]
MGTATNPQSPARPDAPMPLRLLAPMLVLFLAACSSMSEVTPVAKNQYTVSYNAGMKAATWVEIKNQARERARQYCEAQGRKFARPEITSNHATGLMPKKAVVTFYCDEMPQPPAEKN